MTSASRSFVVRVATRKTSSFFVAIPAYHQHTACCSAATVARSGGWSVEASRKEVQFISLKKLIVI